MLLRPFVPSSLQSAGGLYPAAAGRLAKQHGRPYIAFAWAVIQLCDETCGFLVVTDPNRAPETMEALTECNGRTRVQQQNTGTYKAGKKSGP